MINLISHFTLKFWKKSSWDYSQMDIWGLCVQNFPEELWKVKYLFLTLLLWITITHFFTLFLWNCRHKPQITDKGRSCVHCSWISNITAGGRGIKMKTTNIQNISEYFCPILSVLLDRALHSCDYLRTKIITNSYFTFCVRHLCLLFTEININGVSVICPTGIKKPEQRYLCRICRESW